ncbi:hypothetical protein FDP41_003482 [Naegleria fowleri]|uniref:Uncharacterized protein n=1 Tax=Naegleria fowleri TaxID=5763 RepID=A0A6A5BUR0_NAEFO|nr:uncharacterized protein FDP41_003482 [Naegleria fowleri]KAF0977490.1 hypothetical protein FDP41_003482 [Naegleria fowleri]CAG4718884.1 unnamed protein product [Naegleria fowleri]
MPYSFKHVIQHSSNTELQNNSTSTTTRCWKFDNSSVVRRNLFSQTYNGENTEDFVIIGNDHEDHKHENITKVLFPTPDLENDFVATSAFVKKVLQRNKEIPDKSKTMQVDDDDVVLVEFDSLDVVVDLDEL